MRFYIGIPFKRGDYTMLSDGSNKRKFTKSVIIIARRKCENKWSQRTATFTLSVIFTR